MTNVVFTDTRQSNIWPLSCENDFPTTTFPTVISQSGTTPKGLFRARNSYEELDLWCLYGVAPVQGYLRMTDCYQIQQLTDLRLAPVVGMCQDVLCQLVPLVYSYDCNCFVD